MLKTNNEKADEWVLSYGEHNKDLSKGKDYFWKGKYFCTIVSKVGNFGSKIKFLDSDITLEVDNKELSILKKKEKYECKYTDCDYSSKSPQERGKHYKKVHNELGRRKQQEADLITLQARMKDEVYKDIALVLEGASMILPHNSTSYKRYKGKYEILLQEFKKLNDLQIT